jgi:hypothetical protein
VEHGATAVTEFGKRSGWIRLESIKKGAIGTLMCTVLTLFSTALLELFSSEASIGLSMCSSIMCPNLGSALLGLSSTMAL